MADSLTIGGNTYLFDSSSPIDISIPLNFNGEQPNAFGVEPASSIPCEAGDLVGDTRRGGSCNFEQYTFIPHCNGTHTECVGHITKERISIRDCLGDAFVIAAVISIQPDANIDETYSMPIRDSDVVITRDALERAMSQYNSKVQSLILRTLPNDESKLTRRYVGQIPAYFTTEAIKLMVERGIRHLIVDLPSIDRLHDEGRLSNHRVFWNIDQGSFSTDERSRRHATITEFAYIPDGVGDGEYLLNLQIAPFASDAAPSRPILFAILKN